MSHPNEQRHPGGRGGAEAAGRANAHRKTTRRWTDTAPNDPPVDHQDPAYIAAIDAAVERGELEEVDR